MREGNEQVKRRQGSLTIEAVIAFPLFLCFFFLLLFLVRVVSITITLDHAVNEVAKQIAASAYPLAFLNELEDELAAYAEHNLFENHDTATSEAVNTNANEEDLSALILGFMQPQDITFQDIIRLIKNTFLGDDALALQKFLEQQLSSVYYNFKSQGKYQLVQNALAQHINNPFIEWEKLNITCVEMPQSAHEFSFKQAQIETQTEAETGAQAEIQMITLRAGEDYQADDVVIQVAYPLSVPFPFFHDYEFTLIATAVERAWVKGGNGVYTNHSERDVLNLEEEPRIVYVTKTGQCYHREDCYNIRGLTKIPMLWSEARKKYRGCKHCVPL